MSIFSRNHTRNKGGETNSKVKVQIICKPCIMMTAQCWDQPNTQVVNIAVLQLLQ